jgi:hypothetical protein
MPFLKTRHKGKFFFSKNKKSFRKNLPYRQAESGGFGSRKEFVVENV